MKATIKNGNLTVNLYEAVELLSEDELKQLADAVSVQPFVVTYVTQQILDGWTDHSSHSGRIVGAAQFPQGLDWACREVAKRSGEVAKDEIERLEGEVTRLKELLTTARNEIAEMRERNR